MITIEAILDGDCLRPIRELTDEEKLTVTSALSNGIEFIYFQGDEPLVEPIDDVEEVIEPNINSGTLSVENGQLIYTGTNGTITIIADA